MAAKRKNGKKRGGASYRCPACHGVSHVIITRREPVGTVTRIRECLKCSTRFETTERMKKRYDDPPQKKKPSRPSRVREVSLST